MSDHLGNVRGVIGNPAPLDVTATLEDNGQVSMTNSRVQEMAFFKNLSTTSITDVNMNHSGATTAMPMPAYSSYLKWQDGVQGHESKDMSVGPAVGLKVEAGDQINLDAWAKYKKTGNFTKSGIYAAMASILGVNFVGTAPGLDPVSAATQIFQNGLTTAFGLSSGGTEQVPFAYLNYIIYDRSFNPVGGDRKRVTASAGFDPGNEAFSSHEHLILPTINITEPGYIYIFVSNESENAEVWFDDLHVNQVKSSIVAGADYYPFGMPMENRQVTREDYRY